MTLISKYAIKIPYDIVREVADGSFSTNPASNIYSRSNFIVYGLYVPAKSSGGAKIDTGSKCGSSTHGDGYTDADPASNSHPNTDSFAHCYTDTYTHTDSGSHCYAITHTNSDSRPDTYTDTNANPDSGSHRYSSAYSHADPISHRYANTCSHTSPNPRASNRALGRTKSNR